MDRSITTGSRPKSHRAPRLALAITTAIASIALSGCMTAAPQGEISFANAQTALGKGQVDRAITHAEAAVLAEPRNPGFRALLGAAYLEAGRFQSAATSFGDSLDLGDDNPRTVLSFALARIALGEGPAAIAVLDEYARLIDPADLGLALALAGSPERGVHVLVNAVRSSEEASPKLRQNLAYAYALAGNWRAARVMASEDVPADQVDVRLTEWATMSAPELFQQRIATLLGVTPRADSGQPQQLTLANFPAQGVTVAQAAAQAQTDLLADAPTAAEPPVMVAQAETSPGFTQAFAAPAQAVAGAGSAGAGPRYVSNPVVQALPAQATRRAATAPRPAPNMAAAAAPQSRMNAAAAATAPVASAKGATTHLVQLGSYDTKSEAERGWTKLQSRFPQLKNHNLVVTEAMVNGRTFWRVAAEGFGAGSAKSLCSTVKSAGNGCFAYAASSPPAGAVARDVRMASRSK